jgi:translation initiation factor IF-3
LRILGAEGEMLGVVPRDEAMEMAREAGMDLVEINPNERPPICKIMDWGKFRFEQSKKQRKQNTTHTTMKEVHLTPNCGAHDLDIKLKHARDFLAEKHKVLFVVQMRGRQQIYSENALRLVDGLLERLLDVAKVETRPRRDGKRITAVVAPK